MKTDRNILIAFLLNLCFCVAEFIGGALIGSVAIASDALHDLGDALSLGIAYVLERISKRVGLYRLHCNLQPEAAIITYEGMNKGE